MSALAFAISQAPAASNSIDISNMQGASSSLRAYAAGRRSLSVDSAALSRAKQRYARAQTVGNQYAAAFKMGADGTADPLRVEPMNYLLQSDAQVGPRANFACSRNASSHLGATHSGKRMRPTVT